MSDAAATRDPPPRSSFENATPSTRATVAALAGIASAWFAAGSTGLLADPLRHALVWAGLAVATIAAWPGRSGGNRRFVVGAALVAAAVLIAPATTLANVLGVGLVLAALAASAERLDRRLLEATAFSVAVLAIYRLAVDSIPTAWSLADGLGFGLGELAELVWRKPLWIGASFAGLDFLVLTVALAASWLRFTPRPRLLRAVRALVAIVGVHGVYLLVLSMATELYEALPPAPPAPDFREYVPPPWSWSDAVRTLLPWNVPLVAALLHLAVAAGMFRWGSWALVRDNGPDAKSGRPEEVAAQTSRAKNSRKKSGPSSRQAARNASSTATGNTAERARAWRARAITWAPGILAVLVAISVALAPGRSDLSGKTVVAFEEGYVDWQTPAHDRYGAGAAGMYGLLPAFVESLGGRFRRSADLGEDDLAAADVLMLIHPVGNWPKDRLARIEEYVRQGGSLLVLAETPIEDVEVSSRFDEVLEFSKLQAGRDSAVSPTGSWQHAYAEMAHPAITGADDGRNRFGIVLGPSIEAPWPARPLLVGRWGFSDPGIDAVLTGVYRLDAGERLGDLVLAAERRAGRGTVVVLGDTTPLSNRGNVGAYPFSGRLLAYLANRPGLIGNPQAFGRQAAGSLGCFVLIGLLAWHPAPKLTATVLLLLGVSMAACRSYSGLTTRVLPSGEKTPHYQVAYLDASHMEAYSDAGLGADGVGRLSVNLMRNGYLPFLLPQLTGERLAGAGMLISIAPSRGFSTGERAVVREFVERGGIFICTVGADWAGPAGPLLEALGCGVPRSPIRPGEPGDEPKPMGFFPLRYKSDKDSDRYGRVHFHTGWPIQCGDGAVYLHPGDDKRPILAWHPIGRGWVVLVGDTAFAMNKNFDDTIHDNDHFWRWLISRLTDEPDWIPPHVPPPGPDPVPAVRVPDDPATPTRPEATDDPFGAEVAP